MRTLMQLLIVTLIAVTVGCSSSKKGNDAGDPLASNANVNDQGLNLELNGTSDDMSAGAISTVYFAFDSSVVSDAARAILDSNAEFLKANPNVKIQVEGHCDERGSVQYNLALGERRARAIKNYIAALGVDASRVTMISYGKERPIDLGHDEAGWARNRRANFVITAK